MSSMYPMLPQAPTPTGPFTFMPAHGGIASFGAGGPTSTLGRASVLGAQAPVAGPSALSTLVPQMPPSGANFGGRAAAGFQPSMFPGGANLPQAAARMPNDLRFANSLRSAVAKPGGLPLPGVLGQAGRAGKLARGGAGLATGLAADFAADKVFGTEDESIARQAGRGFVRGAGWGLPAAGALAATGVGTLGVPLVAVASGITGTIGAALDVLDAGKWFGGGGGEDAEPAVNPDEILSTIMETAQLDPVMSAQISDQYTILMQLAAAEEDDTIRAQAEAQALNTAGSLVLDALGQRDAISSDASNMLALQSQARDIFEPIAQNVEGSAAMYGSAMQGIRSSLPESMRGIADYQTAQGLSSSNRLANAYRAQAAITPVVDRLTQYQQDFNSFAAQQFAQAMAQQVAGQGASLGPSATDVQALLAASG